LAHLGLLLAFILMTLAPPSAMASQRDPTRARNKTKTTTATLNERFDVRVTWRDFSDGTGDGFVADVMTPPQGTDIVRAESFDSGAFWFFGPNNWELLVKVLNGCAINDRHWVFTAASTDVQYEISVTDTWTGTQKDYMNPLGVAAPAETDTAAFSDSCSLTSAPPVLPGGACEPTDETFCFGDDGRFKVEVEWEDYQNNTGPGRVVELDSAYPDPYTYLLSDDTGVFWFFSPDNWEIMVKVLDGCRFNDNYWVFAAATTNVEYTLEVTDTATDETRSYSNPLGQASPAITDTSAFATCPKLGGGARTRHTEEVEIETEMNRAAAPARFALRSDEGDEDESWFWASCSGFSNGVVGLNGKELTYNPNLGWSGKDSGLCVVSNGVDELEVVVKATVKGPQQ
jgi:hypothetical protein